MTLDEMKSNWSKENNSGTYDQASFKNIVRKRVRKNTNASFQYFWAAFTLQIIVYAMLTHVVIRYWNDPMIVVPGLGGIALFIPFTIVLMRKFKTMAITPLKDESGEAIDTYVSRYRELLGSFYRFKRKYELMLIPLATAIGTLVVFQIYVPGSVRVHPVGAAITFTISLVSCAIAIRRENRKSFEVPMLQLQRLLDEIESE